MNNSSIKCDSDILIWAAKVLKTIAHPVKLEILQLLGQEEPLDVSTLCRRLNLDCELSMMSHHLNKMKDNGILTSFKKGKQVFYSLKNRRILNLLDCLDKFNSNR